MPESRSQPLAVLLLARELGLGGTERQLTQLALHLPKDRFQVHVACFTAQGVRLLEVQAAGIPILDLALGSFRSPALPRALWRLFQYCRRHQIGILHAFDYPGNVLAAAARALRLVPCVLTSQRSHRDLRTSFWRRMLRWTDRRADGIVVNCESVRRHLISEERVPPGRIHLCYNGLDRNAFVATGESRPAGWPVQWPGGGEVIVAGCVAALRAEKGFHLLLEAVARIKDAFPALRLLFVGDGPDSLRLRALAEALGVDSICHWQPAAGDVAPWLRGIDIFVLPSLSEALSNSLMEAMACGCAAVASSTGGNPELISDGENGLLFASGDAADLERKLRRLLEDPALSDRLGQAAREKMRTTFDIGVSAETMGWVYGLFRR